MYDSLDVADFIVKYSNEKGFSINNIKLQKILYFIQAGFLVRYDHPCFRDDIEAWNFGPVVPIVYYAYLPYGGENISYYGNQSNKITKIANEHKALIGQVVNACQRYSSMELIDITCHQKPYIEVYNSYSTTAIKLDTLKKYFSSGE